MVLPFAKRPKPKLCLSLQFGEFPVVCQFIVPDYPGF